MTKDDLKIVFFGTPEFAVESLDALIRNGFNVAAVVTMPDKAAGRGQKLSESAVKKYAAEHGLRLFQPEKLKNEEFVAELKAIGAQLFIVIAFRMLPEVVWQMPELGTFNLHASLLPRYRGAAPINRAVMNGDTRTGVTTFFLKHEIDTGDIIDQESIEIGSDEDAGSVHDRLMKLGATLTVDTVNNIINGTLTTRPQSEFGGITPTPAPKIFKEDCLIDWTKSSNEIHNHIRGLAPYPAAWATLTIEGAEGASETTVKILKSARCHSDTTLPNLKPGELAICGKRAYAGTGHATPIELVTVQPAGKRPMSAPDFLRGLRLEEKHLKAFFK